MLRRKADARHSGNRRTRIGLFVVPAVVVGAAVGTSDLAAVALVVVLVGGIAVRLVPPAWRSMLAMAVLSLTYLQPALAGEYVGELDLRIRLARDVLLVLLGVLLLIRQLGLHLLPAISRPLFTVAAWALLALLLRSPFGASVASQVRYYAVVPVVGLLLGAALTVRLGARKAASNVGRVVVALGVLSAVLGIAQSLGFFGAGYYSGYVVSGLSRGTGIVGQPNNQAFFLLIALAYARRSGFSSRPMIHGSSLLLALGVVATFSRTGLLMLVALFCMPMMRSVGGRLRSRRDGTAVALAMFILFAAPTILELRHSSPITAVQSDLRFSFIARTVHDLGVSGLLLGRPALLVPADSVLGERYVTDNALLDTLVIGGVGFTLAWVFALRRMWTRGHDEVAPLVHTLIVLLVGFGFTSSALRLFPGVLFVWVAVGVAAVRHADASAPAASRQDGAGPADLALAKADGAPA